MAVEQQRTTRRSSRRDFLKSASLLAAGASLPGSFSTGADRGGDARVRYEPTWESLDRHETPRWLMDAKLGLFIYPPHPTEAEYQAYHKKTGRLSPVYRARDAWDTLEWDPDGLARLAVETGARYVVFGIDPYSYFLTYPSKYADIDGSPFVHLRGKGSKKDYVEEIARAVRGRGLKFGIYRNYLHPGKNPYFLETTHELIDRCQPSTLWLDGDKLSYTAEELRSRELAAYYYNHSRRQDEVALEDALGSYKRRTWGKRLEHGDWFRKEMSPPHPEIADGYFVRYETVYRWRNRAPARSAGLVNNLIEWLVDAAAKNGNLELAIHLGPKELLELETRTLRQIGLWLEVNGEAIYETRPWSDGKPESRTAEGIDVRYTTKGDSLYAIVFEWPRGEVGFPRLRADKEMRVEMPGLAGPLKWRQTETGLVIAMPPPGSGEGFEAEIPCDHAFCFKLTPRPVWAHQS